MKKVVFFILMFFGLASYAQTVQSVSIDFDKTKVPGVSLVIAGYDADLLQNALMYRLEKVGGLKGSNYKGFRMYAAQNFPPFGRLNYDIYTFVDKGSKKNPTISINLLVSKGNNNFVSQHDEPEITQKMKDFLTEFSDYIKEYQKVQNIDKLSATIAKLEKECQTLTSDRDKLKKDISNLDSKLKAKEKELSTKESELQKAKSERDVLKSN